MEEYEDETYTEDDTYMVEIAELTAEIYKLNPRAIVALDTNQSLFHQLGCLELILEQNYRMQEEILDSKNMI
ncbi:MAG: hypothetical protein EOP45_10135 [Sphingobacteriaceae bacterium]|nr:MAG: hypothetical protein EOP45_10135 [Sphingobacteriaceae bacterium]